MNVIIYILSIFIGCIQAVFWMVKDACDHDGNWMFLSLRWFCVDCGSVCEVKWVVNWFGMISFDMVIPFLLESSIESECCWDGGIAVKSTVKSWIFKRFDILREF